MDYKRSLKPAWRAMEAFSILAMCLVLTLVSIPSALATDNDTAGQGGASLAPAEFTVRSVPLQESSYTIPQNLIVKNNENEAYLFSVSAEIPPEDSVREGYQPIPNEGWVYPTPSSSFVVEAHSYAVFQLSIQIPPEEQYTGEKWEVWIAVERVEAQSEMISSVMVSRMKIETAGEVSAPGGGITRGVYYLWYVGLGAGLALLALFIALLVWRRRRRKGNESP